MECYPLLELNSYQRITPNSGVNSFSPLDLREPQANSALGLFLRRMGSSMAQTKSALALGGIHHCLFSQGLRSFFLTSDVPFHPIYSQPLEVGPPCWRKVAWSTWRGLRVVRSKPG